MSVRESPGRLDRDPPIQDWIESSTRTGSSLSRMCCPATSSTQLKADLDAASGRYLQARGQS